MNRYKPYLWMAAGLAALTAVASHTAKPLWAQVKAALVQNIDEPGRNPYWSQQVFSSLDCDPTSCHINFAPVPAGKRLVATGLMGDIFVDTPGVLRLRLNPSSRTDSTGMSIPTLLQAGTIDGSNVIGVNAQFTAYFEPGSTPQAIMLPTTRVTPGPADLSELTLSGYLVNLP